MLRDFTQSFLQLVQLRDDIEATYTEFAKHPHHFITGDKFKGYFRPQKLPKSLRTLHEMLNRENPSLPTAQRSFSLVRHHERWLQGRTAALAADEACGDRRYPCTVTFISASQYGAGAWLDLAPDGTFGTKIESPKCEVMLERRGRLNIAMAEGTNDMLLAAGEEADYKGDGMANKGEFNRRHNATNRATYDYVRAAATGPVILGDKEKPHLTEALNAGHVVDLAEICGNDETGADVLYETKVPMPVQKTRHGGRHRDGSGAPCDVGHLYGFGNTLERYLVMVKGCLQRGGPSSGPYDHTTGKGRVSAAKGDYHDGLFNKRSTVVLNLVEALGGLSPTGASRLWRVARRVQVKGARDGTMYGRLRISTKSFVAQHVQRMSRAAVYNDARNICEQIGAHKQKALQRCPHVHAPAP